MFGDQNTEKLCCTGSSRWMGPWMAQQHERDISKLMICSGQVGRKIHVRSLKVSKQPPQDVWSIHWPFPAMAWCDASRPQGGIYFQAGQHTICTKLHWLLGCYGNKRRKICCVATITPWPQPCGASLKVNLWGWAAVCLRTAALGDPAQVQWMWWNGLSDTINRATQHKAFSEQTHFKHYPLIFNHLIIRSRFIFFFPDGA